jgi:hypothetical protein
MVGIELPGEERLPAGPKRDLVVALHELYRGAGKPGLRAIAKAIAKGDYRDMASHEAVSDMLNGKTVPRWSKLDCVVRQLAVWNATPLHPDQVAERFLLMWEAATGGVSVPQPAPNSANEANSVITSVDTGHQQPLRPVSHQGSASIGQSFAEGALAAQASPQGFKDDWWAQSRHALITGQSRWRQPADDRQTAIVRHLRDNHISHPALMGRSSPSDSFPGVRLGMRINCTSLPSMEPTSSAVRSRLLSFLSRQPVSDLISELEVIGRDEKWQKWGGHGRSNHEAVLTSADEQAVPVAWARLLLPEPHTPIGWRDSGSALLLLHIERRCEDLASEQLEPNSIPFLEWHRILRKVLECPTALAGFLTQDLGLDIPLPEAVDDPFEIDPPLPVASVATWLITPQAMTDLVDVSGYQQLPGSPVSRQFDAYAVTDPNGVDAGDMAIDWMRQMCDYSLHLDDYDVSLTELATNQKG